MIGWRKPDPIERAAQAAFEAVARYGRFARERSLAAAQAAVARLMVKQIQRLDAAAARELCHALSAECEGASIEERFLQLKAQLTRRERELVG